MSKSNIFKITLFVFLLLAIMIGFKNAPHPDKKSKSKSAEFAQNDQRINPLDSIIEYLEYKDEVIKKIRQNERKISNLKEKIIIGDIGIKGDYEKPLYELEQRNINLSSRIQQYKEGAPLNWEDFKHQFNVDINKIDKTLSLMAEISLSRN